MAIFSFSHQQLFVVVSGILVMGIFRWFHKNILKNPAYHHQLTQETEKSDEKMSLRKNFKYLASSKYLLCIATIVLTYHICINLTEVTWKDQLLHIYPQPNDFNGYYGKVTMWVGITATMIAIASSFLIRRFSWTINAMIAPALLLITGVGFFSFLFMKDFTFGIALAALWEARRWSLASSSAQSSSVFQEALNIRFLMQQKSSHSFL